MYNKENPFGTEKTGLNSGEDLFLSGLYSEILLYPTVRYDFVRRQRMVRSSCTNAQNDRGIGCPNTLIRTFSPDTAQYILKHSQKAISYLV